MAHKRMTFDEFDAIDRLNRIEPVLLAQGEDGEWSPAANPGEAIRHILREVAPRIGREVDEEACDRVSAYCAEPVTPREP